jgi:hypothetical protein
VRYFLDTEFNGFGGQLISIALIKEVVHLGPEGSWPEMDELDSFYCVMNDFDDRTAEPWVRDNVLPIVTHCGGARMGILPLHKCADRLARWLRPDPNPVIIADWPDDFAYLCKLLITGPGTMVDVRKLTMQLERVDAYPTNMPGAIQHNAWWDAMALRHLILGHDRVSEN